MSRPRPLANLVSAQFGRPEYQVLTPRTPHSRAGRAEEGYTGETVANDDFQEVTQHQSAPLLVSSRSETFPSTGYRSRGDEFDEGKPSGRRVRGEPSLGLLIFCCTYIPLVLGSVLAGFLLFLAFVSYNRPEKLNAYLGVNVSDLGTGPSTNFSTTSLAGGPHQRPTPPIPSQFISYANYTKFPLLSSEYLAECYKLDHGFMSHGKYWEPGAMGTIDVIHHDEQDGYKLPQGDRRICTSTITYMLDGKVGLFADLALLVQAAAFARERNRTLLIDDTYWNRGKWTDYFLDFRHTQPGPEPGCKAPPPEELVACPRLARHWVINSRTVRFHFGHEFHEAYEDPYAHQLNRLKAIYDASSQSFRETIVPNDQSTALIRRAKLELSSLVSPDDAVTLNAYIAIHIRRGDRKPAFYNGKYVPAEDFVQAAIDSWQRLNPAKSPENLFLYVASDSANAYQEVLGLVETRYMTMSLFQSQDPELRALASPEEYVQSDFDQLDETTRILATQGVIVDFALISGLWAEEGDVIPDATVCTFTSNICKLSAVALGWERAFGEVDEMGKVDAGHKRWVEIDQNGWVVPVWAPFELF